MFHILRIHWTGPQTLLEASNAAIRSRSMLHAMAARRSSRVEWAEQAVQASLLRSAVGSLEALIRCSARDLGR